METLSVGRRSARAAHDQLNFPFGTSGQITSQHSTAQPGTVALSEKNAQTTGTRPITTTRWVEADKAVAVCEGGAT